MAIRAPDGANKCKHTLVGEQENISMFSTCSELTPRALIPDGRMERIMQPCKYEKSQISGYIKFTFTARIQAWSSRATERLAHKC